MTRLSTSNKAERRVFHSCYFLVGLCISLFILLPGIALAQETTGGVTIHVVQRGENLFRIALSYGLTTDELAALNGITDPGNIQVGQRILVPISNAAAVLPDTHIVQAGETLQSIASLYGLSQNDLLTQNTQVDPNLIFVGQVLVISGNPVAEAPPIAVPSTDQSTFTGSLIHTIQPGETLFRIATSYGLTVNDLVQANNIPDPTLINAGEQLIIPGVEPPHLALDLPAPITALDVMPLILVEGQTGRVRLTSSIPVTIGGTFLGRNLAAVSEDGGINQIMLVSVPIFTEAGVYPLALNITDANGQVIPISVNIQVASGQYGNETINLLADRGGLLDPNLENAEQVLVEGVMSRFNPTRYFTGPMGLPAAATMTSPFGTKRSYNGGGFDRFHSGADFAGAPGTPILAAAPGVVVLADALNIRGNATIIDHGWGVYTGYWHQTERYVSLGEVVSTGQVIGTVGSTGRVTGAHLHWELWVNGVPVDPMQWARLSFL